ncbi:MAG: transcriptional regulator [Flavobacteriaceae bacterium]|nr:transcriptional regulator [Flavobacteriaceae bacterium]
MELSKKDIDKLKKDIPKIIGKNIRCIRERKNLSQTELANLINSDRQYLYKIESGKVGISVVKLMCISLALETPISSFFEK